MGLKKNQLASQASFGSSLTTLVAGDNVIVPAPSAGKSRVVSLFIAYNLAQVLNADDVSHDLVYKVGGTVVSNTLTLNAATYSSPNSDSFSNLNAFVLAPGEALVLNVATAVDIVGSLTATFCWIDSDVVGTTRVNIPSTTPVTIIPAPPAGRGRRSQLNDEFLFGTGGYFFNGDVGAVNLTVVIEDGTTTTTNIAGINLSQPFPTPVVVPPGGFAAFLSAGLSGNQSLKAFLDSTPAVPLKFYGVYKDFPRAA
jgi:hypothetical protein